MLAGKLVFVRDSWKPGTPLGLQFQHLKNTKLAFQQPDRPRCSSRVVHVPS